MHIFGMLYSFMKRMLLGEFHFSIVQFVTFGQTGIHYSGETLIVFNLNYNGAAQFFHNRKWIIRHLL